MNGIGDHYIKQHKPDLERQNLHVFSHTRNLDYIFNEISLRDKTKRGIFGKRKGTRKEEKRNGNGKVNVISFTLI